MMTTLTASLTVLTQTWLGYGRRHPDRTYDEALAVARAAFSAGDRALAGRALDLADEAHPFVPALYRAVEIAEAQEAVRTARSFEETAAALDAIERCARRHSRPPTATETARASADADDRLRREFGPAGV